MRSDFDRARIYKNGLAVVWKGSRTGQTRDVLKQATKRVRKFSIKKTKIQSACVAAWANKQSKYMLFITFTFPFDPSENEARKIWDLLLKSLRKTFNIKSYVWVKERQQSGRLHYHIIIDRNRIDIKKLQMAFNSAISNVRSDIAINFNSVRLGTMPLIRNVQGIARYLSKYISKTDNIFEKRASGWSDLSLYDDISPEALMKMILDKAIYYKTLHVSQFFSVYVLVDFPQKSNPPPN